MTDKEKAVEWVKAHANKWQVLNRSAWKYEFRGKVMVRFLEETRMDESVIPYVLEYLTTDECIETLSLYDQTVDGSWKPYRAWLEISNKSVGSIHSVRLYHGILTDPKAGADGPYVIEDGCAYLVSVSYYWQQSSPPKVPKSTSGISYRVGNLQRDQESGLYSYTIEKRERVQQDVYEYFTSKSVYKDTTEEYHLGVRQDKVETTGKDASVGGGKLVHRKISKNSDCTSDVHNTTEIERKVESASESVHVGLSGTTRTTVNRNMPEKADDSDLEVGESVENTRTEGGLWNQSIRRVVREAVTWLGRSCRWTVFSHSHTEHSVQGEDPGFDHEVKASEGVVEETRVSRTADGSFDISKSTVVEESVPGASETIHVGLNGTVRTVVNRAMPEKADTSNLSVGDTVENSETEGGRWNQTIRTAVRNAVSRISDACRKTIFAHTHSGVKVVGEDPGFDHVDEAGGGVVRHKSVSLTSDGSYQVSEDTTTEIPVRQSSRTARMTLHGLSVREEHRNQENPLPDPTKVGDSVTNSKTEGGLYNQSVETAGRVGAGKTGESCGRTYYNHSHTVNENVAEPPSPETPFEVGKITKKSVSLNGNGTADVSTSVTEAEPQILKYHYRVSDGVTRYVVKYRNQPTDKKEIVPAYADNVSIDSSKNEFGLYDGRISYTIGSRWSTSTGDLKFLKHGSRIAVWQKSVMGVQRLKYIRWSYYELVWHKGDAYTDYVSDTLQANPNRGLESDEDTVGVIATRLIGRYKDRYGNDLAEWKSVERISRWSEWRKYDNANYPSTLIAEPSNSVYDIIAMLLG